MDTSRIIKGVSDPSTNQLITTYKKIIQLSKQELFFKILLSAVVSVPVVSIR